MLNSQTTAAFFVGFVTLLVFADINNADFLMWDDDWVIYNNPNLHGLTLQSIGNILANQHLSSSWYTPLFGLRLAAIKQFWGLAPYAFHMSNLLFHVADAMLVVVVIRSLLRLSDNTAGEAVQNTAAILGALLWALHPLRVEAVAWSSAGAYGQAFFFLMLSLLAQLRPIATIRTRALAVTAYGAAVLTQPMSLGFAGIPLLLSYWKNRHEETIWKNIFRDMPQILPFIAVAFAFLICNLALQFNSAEYVHKAASLEEFGAFPRIMQAFYLLAYYLWRPFVPFGLTPVDPVLMSFDPTSQPFITNALLVAVIVLALLVFRNRYPFIFVCGLAHLFLLAPLLGLTEHPYWPSDRYSIAAALVESMLFAVIFIFTATKLRILVVGCSIMLCIGITSLTMQQIKVWNNSEMLFRNVIASLNSKSHSDDLKLQYLGKIHFLYGRYLVKQGRIAEAINELGVALDITANKDLAHELIINCRNNSSALPEVEAACSLVLPRSYKVATD